MRLQISSLALFAVLNLVPTFSLAENKNPIEVSVTANRLETDESKTASSTTIITAGELAAKQIRTVGQALRDVPGLDVVESGGPGGNVAVFMRGTNSEHTLVLIDGVEANDPIAPSRAFNFANLTSDNIERIEVVRGPQSVLYGSDAIGGVINIITKRGSENAQAYISSEAGSYGTFIQRAAASGKAQIVDYSLAYSRHDIDGFSAAKNGKEDDAYQANVFSSRLGAALNQNVKLAGFLRYTGSDTDLDNNTATAADDPNRVLENQQLFSRAEVNTDFFNSMLTQQFFLNYAKQKFDDDNDPDTEHPIDLQRSTFDGRSLKVGLQNNLKPAEMLTFTLGAELEREQGSSSFFSQSDFGDFSDVFAQKTARTRSLFLQSLADVNQYISATAGLRVDHHDRFGTKVTWRTGPVVNISETKIHGTVGSAFKAPSLSQLYSQFGDPNLKPEESLGFDLGIEQRIAGDRAALGATFFHSKIDDLISFNSETFKSENIGRARLRGLENFVRIKLCEDTTLKLNYTLTEAQDRELNQELLRRARHKIGANVSMQANPQVKLDLGVHYVGARVDTDFATFPAARVTLGGYTLVDLSASYKLQKNVELFARVENMFDQEYETVLSYGTAGAAGYGGVKVDFD